MYVFNKHRVFMRYCFILSQSLSGDQVREAIWIRRTPESMNRDEGAYQLSNIFNPIITTAPPGGVSASNKTSSV